MRFFTTILILLSMIPLNSEGQTKNHMADIFDSYFDVVQSLNQKDQMNKKEVTAALAKLDKSVQKIKSDPMLNSPLFANSKELITKYVSEINGTHSTENMAYTKYRIERVISLCVSCHTQLPHNAFPPVKRKRILKAEVGTNFEKEIQLAFLLRDYSYAQSLLTQKIEEELRKGKAFSSVERYFIELVKVQLTYNNDLSGLKKTLLQLKNKFSDKDLANIITSSEKRISLWEKMEINNTDETLIEHFIKLHLNKNEKELVDQVYFINGESLVNFALINGMLTNYILKNEKSKKLSKYLYWKGLLENQSDTQSFHSFGDSFLRECIEISPRTEIGLKCFKAYKYSIELGFTGSSGTHVPEDIQSMLKTLEQKVLPKEKSKVKIKQRKIN